MSSRAAFPRLRGLTPARRRGGPEPAGSSSGSSSPSGSLQKGGNRFRSRRRHPRTQQGGPAVTMYRVTDRLHAEHSAEVSCHDLAATVTMWLAELGAHTELVDLARAICAGNRPTAYAIAGRKFHRCIRCCMSSTSCGLPTNHVEVKRSRLRIRAMRPSWRSADSPTRLVFRS